MTRIPDVHYRSDGSIDIDHYRCVAAEERAKSRRLVHDRLDHAFAAIVRSVKEMLLRRPGLRVRVSSPAGR